MSYLHSVQISPVTLVLRWVASVVSAAFIVLMWIPAPQSEVEPAERSFVLASMVVTVLTILCAWSLPCGRPAKCAVGTLLIVCTIVSWALWSI